MDFSAKLSLPYILPNQAQKHVTMNESLRRLDALVQISVISRTVATPPDAPADGDRYIPAAESSGDWEGADGQMAAFQDGAWEIYTPQPGWLAWVEAEAAIYVYDGEAWIDAATGSGSGQLGINAVADSYNRFILRADACLFDHEGAGHQMKINKASDTETASLLFQTAYNGHAEMGLAGNNNFNVKVSPDGQSFLNAILVRSDNGNVGIDTYWPTAKLDVDGPVRIGQFLRADLPDPASTGAGAMVYVSDAPNGATLAFSDGADWRSSQDRSIVST